MKKYLLYSSGILCGTYEFDGKRIFASQRDFETARMSGRHELTEEEENLILGLTKLKLSEIFSGMEAYAAAAASGKERLELPTGEVYEKGSGDELLSRMYMQRNKRFPWNLIVDDGRLVGFLCPCREVISILIEEGYEDLTILREWKKAYGTEEIHPVCFGGTFDVPMRDGVHLSTAVWLPGRTDAADACGAAEGAGEADMPCGAAGETGEANVPCGAAGETGEADVPRGEEKPAAFPAILVRTPYGKETGHEAYYKYIQRGYAVVIQDVRGRNLSEGEWMPNCHEVEDGDDTLNWIASQEWSDGSVGMIGGSYLGYVQWAAAASGNPHLKALVSIVCAGSAFCDLPRRGGSFVSGMMAWAFAVSQKTMKPELMVRDDWDEVLSIRPLNELPKKALGYDIPFLTEWLEHMDEDELWKKSDWQARSVGAQIPALIMSGWFDDDGMGTTQALELTRDYPAGMRKVILGPWQHSGNTCYDLHAMSFGTNAIRLDLDLMYLQWMDRWLKKKDNGIDQTAPVEYYTTGENRWKQAAAWPVPETEERFFCLTSGGHANTSGGDGKLLLETTDFAVKGNGVSPAGDEGPAAEYDHFLYDPEDPAIHIVDMSENEIEVPEDYTEEEKRQDILCYTSEPLKEDIIITGDAVVTLYVGSDAPDTDFVVRLLEVGENGRSVKLADGILSARYRNGFARSEFMEEGQVYKLSIRTTKISNCFKAGRRIRVTVTSSAKNFIFPNSNTKEGFNSPVTRVADNRIYHTAAYPSGILVRTEKKSGCV